MKLVSTKKAAEMMGIEAATLRGWRCAKKGPPFVRISSRSVKYDERDIHTYVAERRFTPSVRATEVNRYAALQATA